ncbi:MAG: hypothetical protein AAB556_02410 [Patescibacteria group bacterium]
MRNKKGITLLLAVFVSSLTLTLGMGIFTLLFGQVGFSSTARESLLAFYAADSGVECAIFWDTQNNSFATSTTSSISCDGESFTVGGASGLSRFTVNFNDGSCAEVEVVKSLETTITSLGKNICQAGSAKTLQRGLRVNY